MGRRQQTDPGARPRRRAWSPPKKLRGAASDFRTRFARRRSRGDMTSAERELSKAGTPADVSSVRAKSSRHGKSTADKWNQ